MIGNECQMLTTPIPQTWWSRLDVSSNAELDTGSIAEKQLSVPHRCRNEASPDARMLGGLITQTVTSLPPGWTL